MLSEPDQRTDLPNLADREGEHLYLAVRPGVPSDPEMPFRVDGNNDINIVRSHATAGEAEAAIHAFCLAHGRTATVSVYTPQGKRWREDEIASDGTVKGTLPTWRALPAARAHP